VLEPVDDALLDEQLAYYRARADEYDDWFERRGRYDRGAAATEAWASEVEIVRGWLRALDLAGRDVLELAPGTGLWTERLLAEGASVTAVDGAPEMLAALDLRCGATRLTPVLANLFTWRAPRSFDAVVSCFFMSHVPDERFDAFCELVADAARDGGAVFLLDGLREPSSTAADHRLPGTADQTMERRLDDGRTFRIVKRFRDDRDVLQRLAAAGIAGEVRRTPTYFQVAIGTVTQSRDVE
jgi:demethylmenaquinone methyltransferase/2-methoxy-6-polyprenyl-1,4-benzoquinol methylase